ncbi:MAG: glycosyl hydrolase [Solirubrobacteraceae bacterium]
MLPVTRRKRRLTERALALCIAPLAVAAIVLGLVAGSSRSPRRPTATCVDPGPSLTSLSHFERAVGGNVHCVVVFDQAPTWAAWQAPWFATNRIADENWVAFARHPGNRLIITLAMFPSELADSGWRAAGAAGAYATHARTLAGNLVRAGMSHAVIRLGHEANGTWYADNVGDTATQQQQWKRFWRRTAMAMGSVPGAHFSFDWCVAAGYRPIAFANYYPGDDVVDSIGIDIYDRVPPGHTRRWSYLYDEPGGVGALVRFATAHHKPLAVPEWGLEPRGYHAGAGPDPGFTRGIAALVAHHQVAFQGYFFRSEEAAALLADRDSLAIYRRRLLR